MIRTDRAAKQRSTAQTDHVGGGVRGTTWHIGSPLDLNDRYRSLWGDAPDLPPEVFVQHDVADDEDLPIPEGSQDILLDLAFRTVVPLWSWGVG